MHILIVEDDTDIAANLHAYPAKPFALKEVVVRIELPALRCGALPDGGNVKGTAHRRGYRPVNPDAA